MHLPASSSIQSSPVTFPDIVFPTARSTSSSPSSISPAQSPPSQQSDQTTSLPSFVSPQSFTTILLATAGLHGPPSGSSQSPQQASKLAHFPWPALACPIGFLMVFTTAFSLYVHKRSRRLQRLGLAPSKSPSELTSVPATDTPGFSARDYSLGSPVPAGSPTMEVDTSAGGGLISSRATFVSTSMPIRRSTHNRAMASGDTMREDARAMAEWAALGTLPQLVNYYQGQSQLTSKRMEEDPDQRTASSSAFLITERSCDLGTPRLGLDNIHTQAKEDDNSGIQVRRSTLMQETMSMSGATVTSIMTEPPPPYTAGASPSASFRPEDFDLSLVTARITHARAENSA